MEEEKRYTINKEQEKIKSPRINYDHLIATYYYEALAFQNVFYQNHFEKAVNKLKDSLLDYFNDYLNKGDEVDLSEKRLEGHFRSYIIQVRDYLNTESDYKKIFQQINEFLMIIHEKIRSMIGENMLGFSDFELKSLNHIDISKPLSEQREIIANKIKEKYSEK